MANTINYRKYSIPFLVMALAVILGAFGSHMLSDRISEHYMGVYRTASLYHFVHGLGWIVGLLFLDQIESTHKVLYQVIIALGVLLFSGSLYILALNEMLSMPGLKIMGAITPIGGLCYIASWLLLAYETYRFKN